MLLPSYSLFLLSSSPAFDSQCWGWWQGHSTKPGEKIVNMSGSLRETLQEAASIGSGLIGNRLMHL